MSSSAAHGNGTAAAWSSGGAPPRSPEAVRMAGLSPGSPTNSNTASDEYSEQSYPYFVYSNTNQIGGPDNKLLRSSTPESPILAEAVQQVATCDSNIAKHQELWLFDAASRSASRCIEWSNPSPAPGQASTVTAALVQAPSSFNNPCKMRKVFRPPFIIKITVACPGSVAITCKATCYMLSQQQVATIAMWNPEIHGPEAMLTGNTLEQQLTSTSGYTVLPLSISEVLFGRAWHPQRAQGVTMSCAGNPLYPPKFLPSQAGMGSRLSRRWSSRTSSLCSRPV